MKRNIPLIVAFVSGVIILIAGFIPRDPFPRIESTLIDWFMIISSFILLGQASCA